MPFDMLTMAAVQDELQAKVLRGRIQKIIQTAPAGLALAIYAAGEQKWLVLSADASMARVYLSSQRQTSAFPSPSPFIMLLRKYLEGGHIENVHQIEGERVLHLVCERAGAHYRLAAEVMGKHSNVVLVDEDGTVLGALKTISPRQSRIRPLAPGYRYDLPPAQQRRQELYGQGQLVDPTDEVTVARLLRAPSGETRIGRALVGLLRGTSPFAAGQIARMAGYHPDAPLGQADPEVLARSAAGFFRVLATRSWQPTTFRGEGDALDFAPYVPVAVESIELKPSISAAIQEVEAAEEPRDRLGTVRSRLLEEVDRRRLSLERKRRSLEEGLSASTEATTVMEQGQLILAFGHLVQPKMEALELPELDMTIPLDPRLDSAGNAERYFRRYRKLRDAARRLPDLLAETDLEEQRLNDLKDFVQLASTDSELAVLERELSPRRAEGDGRRKKAQKRGPARYRRGEATALAGRTARENEEVTFRLARREDIWLHARERTGAHVVLSGASSANDDEVQAAAELAAYLSAARDEGWVDVDVTQVRNVRKIPGGAPGRVSYRHFRTVRVRPSLEGWSRRG